MANKKDYISDELLAAYLDGNTNEEETLQVLNAMKKDQTLQEVLNVGINIEAEQESQENLPLMRMAAESGKNICSVLCEAYILQQRGFEINIDSLLTSARSHNWLKTEGTPLHCIGRLLEQEKLMVTRKYNATIEDIQEALAKKNSIIVVVDSDKLFPDQIDLEDLPNHAIVIRGFDSDKNQIIIFDPQRGSIFTVHYSLFEVAWKESYNYMVRVLCNIEDYQPQPIPLDDISLTDDLMELREAIAENAHEVWSAARIAEGWTYGPVRDDKKKQHPDLVPYSALPDIEKEYDRIMAMNTIKLVKKLGFDVSRK